jgi:hypothetical protein
VPQTNILVDLIDLVPRLHAVEYASLKLRQREGQPVGDAVRLCQPVAVGRRETQAIVLYAPE